MICSKCLINVKYRYYWRLIVVFMRWSIGTTTGALSSASELVFLAVLERDEVFSPWAIISWSELCFLSVSFPQENYVVALYETLPSFSSIFWDGCLVIWVSSKWLKQIAFFQLSQLIMPNISRLIMERFLSVFCKAKQTK